MPVNNITRFLDAHNIDYTSFELPKEKLGAEATAKLLGVPIFSVYKTIVVMREKKGKPILAVVAGDREVNLKKLAECLNEKKLRVPTQQEAETITGLQTGGISPLALINRGFQIIVDSTALSLRELHISGGQRGLNIRLNSKDLITVTGARTAEITDPPGSKK